MSTSTKPPHPNRTSNTYEEVYRSVERALRKGISKITRSNEPLTGADIMVLSRDDPTWLQKYLAALDTSLKVLKEMISTPLFIIFKPGRLDQNYTDIVSNVMTLSFNDGYTYYVWLDGTTTIDAFYRYHITIGKSNDIPYVSVSMGKIPYAYVNVRGSVVKAKMRNKSIKVLKQIACFVGCYSLNEVSDAATNNAYLMPSKVAKPSSKPSSFVVKTKGGAVAKIPRINIMDPDLVVDTDSMRHGALDIVLKINT